jgi:hypothetical protein
MRTSSSPSPAPSPSASRPRDRWPSGHRIRGRRICRKTCWSRPKGSTIGESSPDPGSTFLALCASARGPDSRTGSHHGGSPRQIRAEELDLRVVVILNGRGRGRSIRCCSGLGFVPAERPGYSPQLRSRLVGSSRDRMLPMMRSRSATSSASSTSITESRTVAT